MQNNQPIWIRCIVRINLIVGGLAVVAMLVHIIIDVTARHLFHIPVQGTLEIVSFYYMVGLIYLAIPIVQARSEHIFVELFTVNMDPRRRDRLDGCIRLYMVLVLGLFTWVTASEALHQSQIGTVVEAGTGTIPVWPTRWLLPLSMASTTLICLWQAWFLFTHPGEGTAEHLPENANV